MKYLKSIKTNYVELLNQIYSDAFKQVFEQNKNLKSELDFVEDAFVYAFDYLNEHPKRQYSLYFYEPDAESLEKFKLRIYEKDLMDVDNYFDDYKYFSNILLRKDMEVYFLVFYYFDELPKQIDIDKHLIIGDMLDDINHRIVSVDFEPYYFTNPFGDPTHKRTIGCYKKANLDYKFNLDYLSDVPEYLKNDIHVFKNKHNLSKSAVKDLLELINKVRNP